MAHIDPATEQRIADRRSRLRQDRVVPLLIRDDGMLYPNTKLVARNPRFRPYHGDPKASLQDRLRFLKGLAATRAVTYNPEPEEPFDIGTADADALMVFAQEQYGAALDPSKPVKVLREQVFKLSQLEDVDTGSDDADGDEPPAGAQTAEQYAASQPAAKAASAAPRTRRGRGMSSE